MISIIVAIAENYAIGKNNDLLCYIPGDLKRFKSITLGHPVIMGKKTWLSLPKKPLSGRTNIVITDLREEVFQDCTTVYSLAEALDQVHQEEESFIIGGASIYKQFLPLADRLYITWIHKDFEGDVFFPEIDFSEWELLSQEDFPFTEQTGFSYSYNNYRRKKSF